MTTSSLSDAQLDRWLQRFDPATRVPEQYLQQMLHSTRVAAEHAPVRRRRTRRTVTIVALVSALAVGGATPAVAAAVHFFAQTGWFGDSPNPGGQAAGAPGQEWINSGRGDFTDYAVTVLPNYVTVPVGYSRAGFAAADAKQLSEASEGALMHRVNIERHFETAARCLWMNQWLRADKAGDAKAVAQATATLQASASWHATVQTDGGGIAAMYQKLGRQAAHGTVQR